MRLTADLITNSLSYLNPLKERELDLRGHRIPAIENLGVAGPHDAMDLTDNDIQVLGNFPLSPRIRTLLLARNRVAAIQPSLPAAAPGLRNLVLASNHLADLPDLEPLRGWARLTHLVLTDNPVTKKENYRYWVLWLCPTVRFLDYKKVKDAERQQGRQLFGTAEAPTELASKILGTKASNTFDMAMTSLEKPSAGQTSKLSRLKLTGKERAKLQDMIKKADSLEEIKRLEDALDQGKLPPGFAVGDEMEE